MQQTIQYSECDMHINIQLVIKDAHKMYPHKYWIAMCDMWSNIQDLSRDRW